MTKLELQAIMLGISTRLERKAEMGADLPQETLESEDLKLAIKEGYEHFAFLNSIKDEPVLRELSLQEMFKTQEIRAPMGAAIEVFQLWKRMEFPENPIAF